MLESFMNVLLDKNLESVSREFLAKDNMASDQTEASLIFCFNMTLEKSRESEMTK